jgi:hypothetical protein
MQQVCSSARLQLRRRGRALHKVIQAERGNSNRPVLSPDPNIITTLLKRNKYRQARHPTA